MGNLTGIMVIHAITTIDVKGGKPNIEPLGCT